LLVWLAERAPEAIHPMEAQDRKDPEPNPARDELRHILDGAGEAILVTEVSSGRVVDANETACRWLRMAHGQLVTRHLSDLPLLSPIRLDRPSQDTFTDTRRAARPQQLDHGVVQRRDGTTFPVEITMVRRRVGDRDYVLTVARDISARGPLEEALHERDALYRGLLALSRDAVFVCSRGGLVSHANGTAAKLFGYSPMEFLGLDARLLFAGADELYRFQGSVLEAGTVRDLPVGMRGKDGSAIRVLLTGAVRRDADGAVLDYQCTVRRQGEGTEGTGRTAAEEVETPETDGSGGTVASPEPAEASPRAEPAAPAEPDEAKTVAPRDPPAPRAGQQRPHPDSVPTATQRTPAPPPRAPVTELRAELHVREGAQNSADHAAPPVLSTGRSPAPRPATGHAIVRITDLGRSTRLQPVRKMEARREAGAAPAATMGGRSPQGQSQAGPRHYAAPRPRARRRSPGPRPVYAAPAAHESARVPFWTATACVGAALTVVGWADLALLWFPLRFGRPEWEFATIGAHFDHMALGTAGVLLLALGIAHRGWWAPAQALAMASQLIAIGLVAVYAVFIVAAPQAWHNVAPQLEPTIGRAVRKVSVYAVGYAAAYTWLAVYLWRKVKRAQEGSP
jgi:PAS domain S-box-containing protein